MSMDSTLSYGAVSFREKVLFTFSVFTQNMVFAFVSAYIMIFFTDFVGIRAGEVGTLMLLARVFDAVNDPIMGMISEKTRSPWGKFRPYLFLIPIPLIVLLYLLFTSFSSTYISHLVWAYLSYVLFWVAFTVADIPLWGLTSVISRQQVERMRLISFGKAIAPIAFVVVSVVSIPLIRLFGNDMYAYRSVAMIFGVLMVIALTLLAIYSKERIPARPEVLSFRQMALLLKQNRLLRRILISQAFIFIIDSLVTAMVVFYATYNLKSVDLVPIISLAIVIPMTIGIFVATRLAKVMDKKTLLISSLLLRFIGYLLLFFIGWSDPALLILTIAFVALTFGVPEVLLPSMMIETIDYMEHKTGKRADGIVWSTQTFVVKIGASVGGFILGHALMISGFVPNSVQTEQTLSLMHATLFLIPAFFTVMSILPMLRYDLTKEKYQSVLTSLNQRSSGH